MLPNLSHEEILRYSRHLLIPDVGMEGQRKLKAASVLIIGTGGLGSPVALYLAAAGVGRIGLVDYDVVDRSNLQRQVIHGTSTVGRLKVESARERMLDLNPDIQVDIYNQAFTSENAMRDRRAVRPDRRWKRQLPHTLPDQRPVRADRQAQRLRVGLPLRRAGERVRCPGGSVLPLPVP